MCRLYLATYPITNISCIVYLRIIVYVYMECFYLLFLCFDGLVCIVGNSSRADVENTCVVVVENHGEKSCLKSR